MLLISRLNHLDHIETFAVRRTYGRKLTVAAQKLIGKVTSVSMQKTAIVTVDRLSEHPIYKKRSKVSKTYTAHIEEAKFKLGDKVELQPCRPLSKRKRFIVSRVIQRTSPE